MNYDQFIKSKTTVTHTYGFEPGPINPKLFDWQKQLVAWAVRLGRAALFEDCGLGKTAQQLEWARQVSEHTGKPVGIFCPLAVAEQTVREGKFFGIEVKHVREADEIGDAKIVVTNYERLEKFDDVDFSGVVLDESSILKNFMGKTRMRLTARFVNTPYRLCCTATPAPNDYMEFGQHCEFLGIMPSNEMLCRWFINDTMNFGTYRLKGHARKDFWEWVATWAACISKPSDIGYSDEGFILPPLNMEIVKVEVDQVSGRDEGEMFRTASLNATNMHKEMRITCANRAAAVAEKVNGSKESWVVWCNTNYEADALGKLIPDATEVRGSDDEDHKETAFEEFTTGAVRVIISKPSIAGMGLNWQHCRNHIFTGLSYSFEDFYQAMRRGYRFGQKQQFNCYIVQSETEDAILQTVFDKMEEHNQMRQEMKMAAEVLKQGERKLSMNKKITTERGESWTLHNGDCVRVLKKTDDESVDFSVYSPPFANLYIYSDDIQDMGNCEGTDEFMEQYAFVLKELLRITKVGCLSAVHCKNLVEYKGRDGRSGLHDFRGEIIRAHEANGWQYHSEHVIWKDPVIEMQRTKAQGLLFKQLCQNSRFNRAGMPEYVLLFRKWGDDMSNAVAHPIGEHSAWPYIGESGPVAGQYSDERQREIQTWQRYASPVWMDISQTRVLNTAQARDAQDEKHICPLQLDVIDRLLWLYTNRGDTVFSPFAGIGSEGYCALAMGRKFIGAELKESYFKQACQWLKKAEAESLSVFEFAK